MNRDTLSGAVRPRARVLIDNDFSGDRDDIFQLVHHLLSPSVTIPGIVASHLSADDILDPSNRQVENAARIAEETLEVLGMTGDIPIHLGCNVALTDGTSPRDSPAARAIIAEALREDDLPLYYCAGAGLTDLASALMLEPSIAERMTLVWIGGAEHPGLAAPLSGAPAVEYNHNIDRPAVRYVFNDSKIPMWQFPRDVYRQALVSYAELDARVAPHGALGAYLMESLRWMIDWAARAGRNLGETHALGDNPLVLATALQSSFQPDTSSSDYVVRPTPGIGPDDVYSGESRTPRPMRVYTRLDTRLMMEDFYGRIALHARGAEWAPAVLGSTSARQLTSSSRL